MTIELPKAYILALKQMAQQTNKTLIEIILEALDLWFDIKSDPNIISCSQPKPTSTANPTAPIYQSQLYIIPKGTSYGLLLELDNQYWLENRSYSSLALAIKRIEELSQLGYTQLNNWLAKYKERPVLTLRNSKGKPHLWLGQDTACRMWSTSGMKQSSSYKLTATVTTESYCTMCVNNFAKIRDPKVPVVFNELKQLIIPSIEEIDEPS